MQKSTLLFIFKVTFMFIIVEWRQNLNRDYKKISPQKMSPSHLWKDGALV